MRTKLTTGLVALIFACASILVVASCAKKQVRVSEAVQPGEEKGVEAKGRAGAEAGMTEQERAEEATRQAELQKQEMKEMVAEFNSENIYFAFDRAVLKAEAKEVLREKAEFLREHPAYSVRIAGHCDERGTNEYNLALGERRAHAAKEFLVALGISEDRISTISYGEERPVDPRHNEEAWAKNRRDEFKAIQ